MRRFRRLAPHLRRHRADYLLGLVLVLLATACGIAAPLLVRHAVNRLEHNATREFILQAAGAILLFAVVRGALLFGGRYRILAASRRVEYEMRNDLYAHLETLSARTYDLNSAGDIASRTINDLEAVRMMIGPGLMMVVSTSLLAAASLLAMFVLQPDLAAFCAVPLALVSAVTAWTGRKIHDLSLAVQAQLGVLSTRAQENFSGTRVVRAFAQEENETERFRAACGEYRDRNLRLASWRALSWASILLLTGTAIGVTLYAGGRRIMEGTFTKGDFAAFTAYQFMLVWPMMAIGWVVNLAQRGAACMGRMDELLDTPPETDDRRAVPGAGPLRGLIEARGLTFSYAPDRPPALKDLTLRIEPGWKAAVVGRTGSGKSALLHLLLRFYRVPDGALFLDGRDVNTIPLAELRGAIGPVLQDIFLFSDTIRENIAFGARDGTDGGAVARAAEAARFSPDVERFPGRFDQMIGERGVTLSGGQKQRAALARALARDPQILLLDDAFSGVDSQTEAEIHERLCETLKGRTCVMVTHRLTAITDADRIFVLDEGRLAEEGSHGELLARGGIYAMLWENQKLREDILKA